MYKLYQRYFIYRRIFVHTVLDDFRLDDEDRLLEAAASESLYSCMIQLVLTPSEDAPI